MKSIKEKDWVTLSWILNREWKENGNGWVAGGHGAPHWERVSISTCITYTYRTYSEAQYYIRDSFAVYRNYFPIVTHIYAPCYNIYRLFYYSQTKWFLLSEIPIKLCKQYRHTESIYSNLRWIFKSYQFINYAFWWTFAINFE